MGVDDRIVLDSEKDRVGVYGLRSGGHFVGGGGIEWRFSADSEELEVPLICCNCGLTHRVTVRKEGGKIVFSVDGDDETTAEVHAIIGGNPVPEGWASSLLAGAVPEAKRG